MDRTVLITGASSGLGLAFLIRYASQPNTKIIALDLVPPPPDIASQPNITYHQTDITSDSALSSLSTQLSETPLHLLIHSAGIRGLVPHVVEAKRGDVAAAETLEVMDRQTMMRTLEINTWGTFNVIRAFAPNLRRAAVEVAGAGGGSGGRSDGATVPKVVVLSSRMGSLAANTGGGGYAYRASKAGLNAIVKSFSIDVPKVVFLLLHPGRVETGLVEWKEEGAMSAEESLETCVSVIEGVERADSGKFLDRFGDEIRW